MSTKLLKKIQSTENKRSELVSQLLEEKKMTRGSFCQIFVKCGKKNCWCFKGKGHPHWRMSLREQGKQFSRAVPVEEYEWIRETTKNYRDFKKIRKEIVALDKKIGILLDRYEDYRIKHSKKGKLYLQVEKEISEGKFKKRSETKKIV